MFAQMLLLALVVVAGYSLGAFDGLVPSIITTVVVVLVIPELLKLWLVARHRQDIQSYIQDHAVDIQSAA